MAKVCLIKCGPFHENACMTNVAANEKAALEWLVKNGYEKDSGINAGLFCRINPNAKKPSDNWYAKLEETDLIE